MDTEIQTPGSQTSGGMDKRTILIAVVTIVLVIGAFLGIRYLQYLDYLKTSEDDAALQDSKGLSSEDQKELAELDRLRAEYQAISGSLATTTVVSQIKSLDALRQKTKPRVSTPSTTEQQLNELDALRARTQTP